MIQEETQPLTSTHTYTSYKHTFLYTHTLVYTPTHLYTHTPIIALLAKYSDGILYIVLMPHRFNFG